MPMIEVSEEEYDRRRQVELVGEILEAEREGDYALAAKLKKVLAPPPEVLLAVKRAMGADWIRERGYDTRRADREYGPGWLDA